MTRACARRARASSDSARGCAEERRENKLDFAATYGIALGDQRRESVLRVLRRAARLAVRMLAWVAGGLVATVAVLLVLLLKGPPEKLGDVTFMVENLRSETVTIVDFDLPSRVGTNRDPPRPSVRDPRPGWITTVAGPMDLPPGDHVGRLIWYSPSSDGLVETEITVSPVIRRACEVRIIFQPDNIIVEPCFIVGPRPWYQFD